MPLIVTMPKGRRLDCIINRHDRVIRLGLVVYPSGRMFRIDTPKPIPTNARKISDDRVECAMRGLSPAAEKTPLK